MNSKPSQPPEKIVMDRILTSFSSVYLTLISILQSAMIGYLVFVVHTNLADFKLGEWIRVIAASTFVILVWNEYRMGSSCLRWVPTFVDSFIPFLLACGQIFLIRSITTPGDWFLASAIVFGIAVWAYSNMYKKSEVIVENGSWKENGSVNSLILNAIRPYRTRNPAYCISYAAMCYYFSLISRKLERNHSLILLFSCICLVAHVLFVMRGNNYWKSILRAARITRAN